MIFLSGIAGIFVAALCKLILRPTSVRRKKITSPFKENNASLITLKRNNKIRLSKNQ